MLIRVFVGSSTEGLDVAEYIKKILEQDNDGAGHEIECILWNDGTVFKQNTSFLDSLMKAASMFDFGIMVVTSDNKATVRQKKVNTPNDNVIFEFGLFIGRLGTNRAFILQEGNTKLPSDLSGISIATFEKGENIQDSESLKKQIKNFKEIIFDKINLRELGLLPSTGLAIGYFNNFIDPTCKLLYGAEFDGETVEIEKTIYKKFELHIYFPNDLIDNMRLKSDFYFKQNAFKPYTLKTKEGRETKTQYKIDPGNPEKVIFCDMPTTLNALYNSIVMYLKKGGAIGKDAEHNLIEDREMNNFKLTLQTMLDRNPYAKNIIKIVEEQP